jgi:hypothetical protein
MALTTSRIPAAIAARIRLVSLGGGSADGGGGGGGGGGGASHVGSLLFANLEPVRRWMGTCRGVLRLVRTRHSGHRTTHTTQTIARASYDLPPGKTGHVALQISAAVRHRLFARKKTRATVTLEVHPVNGGPSLRRSAVLIRKTR